MGEKDDMADDGWWRGATIYQIYPRSFLDTDGDGIGDLRGIVRKLDYVASLGVDAIWLSPFYPSPMRDFGYDITEHCSVDPEYGDLDDFASIIEEAHARDLKVIIDGVLNHTSIDHPWFRQSRQSQDNPKADWYQWANPLPDGSPPNNWISRFAESQWTWCPVREQYYRHQYMREQPALNLRNPEVVAKRTEFMGKWLDRGVDGIRFDAVTQYMADPDLRDNPPGNPNDHCITPVGSFSSYAYQLHENDCNHPDGAEFVAKLVDEVECQGCTFNFGELDTRYKAYQSLERFTGPNLFHAGYTPDFMEISLCPSALAQICKAVNESAGFDRHVWALTNHDASRIVTRWGPQRASEDTRKRISKLAITLLASLEGELTFFQGEELGLPDADYDYDELKDPQGLRFWPKGKGRDPIRHPFPWTDGPAGGFSEGEPWLPVREEIVARNAAAQDDDPGSVLNHWREVIRLRQREPVLRHGKMTVLMAEDETGVFGLRREGEDGRIEAWFNLNMARNEVPQPEGEIVLRSDRPLSEPFSFVLVRG